jgi:hypothetical protein
MQYLSFAGVSLLLLVWTSIVEVAGGGTSDTADCLLLDFFFSLEVCSLCRRRPWYFLKIYQVKYIPYLYAIVSEFCKRWVTWAKKEQCAGTQ